MAGQRLRPLERFDRLSEPLGRTCRGVGIAAHDDGELVAADAEDLFPGAGLVLEDARDGDEHPVADGVSPRVVDLLELVEIDEHECDGGLPARGLLDERLEVLVEGASVAQVREGVSSRLGLAVRELAPAREVAGGDVGERADEVVVEVELDVGGHDDEQHAEALAVGEQGHGRGGAARNAVRPIEVDQLAAARSRPSCLSVGAADDPRRLARPGVGLRVDVRAEHTGRHELRLRREVDSRQGGAGQLARLTGEKADRTLLAERAGERVREAEERLARALQRALELPQGCALDDERRGAGFEHPLDGLLVDRGP